MFDPCCVCSFVQVVPLREIAHIHAVLLFPSFLLQRTKVKEACASCIFLLSLLLLGSFALAWETRPCEHSINSILNIAIFERAMKNLPLVVLRT